MKALDFTINPRTALLVSALSVFFLLTIFLLRELLIEDGLPYTRDLIFPYDLELSYDSSLYAWDDLHSQRNLEINKIPLFYILHQLSALFGSELVVKGLFVITLYLVPSIMFVSLFFLFNKRAKSTLQLAIICSLPSLFYLFNPVVVDRISNHLFMVAGYALNPLIVVAFVQVIEKDRIKPVRLFCVALLITVSSIVSTHNTFYILPILLFLGLFYLVVVRDPHKRPLIAKSIGYLFGMYFLFNLFWILPISSSYFSSQLSPSYALEIEDILELSQFNSISNVFQLIGGGGWQPVLQIPNFNQAMIPLTIVFANLVPVVSLSTLVLYRKNKFVIALGLILGFIFILSLGQNSPIPLYSWFYSTAPFASFIWIFRDPTRLLQYTALIYSIFLSLALYWILHSRHRYMHDIRPALIVFLCASIVLSPSFYTFLNHAGGRLVPSTLPDDYDQVFRIIRDVPGSFGVLWLPMKQYYVYQWNNADDEVAGDFHFASSPKKTYGFTTQSSVIGSKFWNYFYDNLLKDYRSNELGSLLSLFGVKYIIVHDDLVGPQDTETDRIARVLDLQQDIIPTDYIGEYIIYENTEYRHMQDTFYTLSINRSDNVKSIESFIAKPVGLKLPQEPLEWTTIGKPQSEYNITLEGGMNAENFNKLSFEVYASNKSQDQTLDIILKTNSSDFNFKRSLELGEWNNLDINLRGAKVGSAARGLHLNLQNLSEITLVADGNNSFAIKDMELGYASDNDSGYDSMKLLNQWRSVEAENNSTISFSKISPTKYILNSNSTQPYLLTFVDAYDPHWKVKYQYNDGKTRVISSVPVFSSLNGFPIVDAGNITIEVYYDVQEFVDIGSTISLASMAAIGSYIILIQIRHKKRQLSILANKI